MRPTSRHGALPSILVTDAFCLGVLLWCGSGLLAWVYAGCLPRGRQSPPQSVRSVSPRHQGRSLLIVKFLLQTVLVLLLRDEVVAVCILAVALRERLHVY